MELKLEKAQSDALAGRGDESVYVTDPATGENYVLLRAEDYLRIQALAESGDFELSESYPAQERSAGAAGWDDPIMDQYNEYDKYIKKV